MRRLEKRTIEVEIVATPSLPRARRWRRLGEAWTDDNLPGWVEENGRLPITEVDRVAMEHSNGAPATWLDGMAMIIVWANECPYLDVRLVTPGLEGMVVRVRGAEWVDRLARRASRGRGEMRVLERITVPTGDILIVDGDRGRLEMLSLADYGAAVNLNQGAEVPDGTPLMPLTEKWVVTISTQYGCSMGCEFCDVPKVGPGRNATIIDLTGQIMAALELPGVPSWTRRLNVHFARMGEPSWNPAVIECARWLHKKWEYNPHPVVSTMMPYRNSRLGGFIEQWMTIKNELYSGNAGLQISVNSTDEAERSRMFNGNAMGLEAIASILRRHEVVGRKITLNFAVTGRYTIDEWKLAGLFSPEKFVVKLTPMHQTAGAVGRGLGETAVESYREVEARLKSVGFDVLVFIASHEEDAGRITCGNAILSGTRPFDGK